MDPHCCLSLQGDEINVLPLLKPEPDNFGTFGSFSFLPVFNCVICYFANL